MASARDADRYADLKLDLECPVCKTSGLIPWKSLDRVLYCSRCAALYRVEPQALVVLPQPEHDEVSVQVRTSLSEWREHAIQMRKKLSLKAQVRDLCRKLIRDRRTYWAAGVLACVLLILTISLRGRPSIPQPLILPTTLEERAALLAQSLPARHMEPVMALTLPPQHRRMRSWLGHECPVKPTADTDAPSQVSAEVLGVSKAVSVGDHSDVRIRLTGLKGGDLLMVQQWVLHDDVWYFQPPPPVKSTVKGPVSKPYSKPTRRAAKRY